MIAEGLTDEGFDVVEAGCGDEAAGLIDGMQFDLLLTDVHMPGQMDGLDVAAHARRVSPDLPIVVVTGRPDLRRGISDLQPRCAMVLKPYRMRAILDAIEVVSV